MKKCRIWFSEGWDYLHHYGVQKLVSPGTDSFAFLLFFLKFFKLKLPSKLESHLPLSGRQYVKKRVKPIHLTKYSGLFIYTQSSILYSKNWFISRCIGMNPTVHMLYSNIQVMNIYMILEWLFCSYSNGTNYAQK